MNKLFPKLMTAAVAVVLALVLSVMMTYAWTVVSTTPVAEGIQITIGGGNTILIAPDLSQTVNGETCHFPGAFSGQLNFSHYAGYDYLSEIPALMPVSTADGKHWIIPEYYDISDEEVQNGEACVGTMKPISQFTVDTQLAYANLTEPPTKGGYLYLDFWVVSPMTDYTLRMSHGDENGGSYLVEWMTAEETEDGGFVLEPTEGQLAASARIGFLVNSVPGTSGMLNCYRASPTYSDRYTALCGVYPEVGQSAAETDDRFVIYEPNADLHPQGSNGMYVATRPLSLTDGEIDETEIWDRLAVSLQSQWRTSGTIGVPVQELFQTALTGKRVSSPQEAETVFYRDYLQGYLMPYIEKGLFVRSTTALQGACNASGVINTDVFPHLQFAGATDDMQIVTLKKNVPQRIRMFIWIEGQDIDCVSPESTATLAVSVELAGSN